MSYNGYYVKYSQSVKMSRHYNSGNTHSYLMLLFATIPAQPPISRSGVCGKKWEYNTKKVFKGKEKRLRKGTLDGAKRNFRNA